MKGAHLRPGLLEYERYSSCILRRGMVCELSLVRNSPNQASNWLLFA
jgi:hypothetical protein